MINESIIVSILGILIGSFLNVCIYRIPAKKSISFPPSHCPVCKKNLKWYDNIPLISYFILLRGRCRRCNTKISIQYPLIEILCGVLYFIFFQKFGFSEVGILSLIIVPLAIVGGIIDLKKRYIPDRVTGIIILIGLIYNLLNSNIERSILGMGAYSLVFLILYGYGESVFKREVMGFGDVKVALGLGSVLTFVSFQEVLYFLNITFILGAVLGVIILTIQKKLNKGQELALGPYIYIAGLTILYMR